MPNEGYFYGNYLVTLTKSEAGFETLSRSAKIVRQRRSTFEAGDDFLKATSTGKCQHYISKIDRIFH